MYKVIGILLMKQILEIIPVAIIILLITFIGASDFLWGIGSSNNKYFRYRIFIDAQASPFQTNIYSIKNNCVEFFNMGSDHKIICGSYRIYDN